MQENGNDRTAKLKNERSRRAGKKDSARRKISRILIRVFLVIAGAVLGIRFYYLNAQGLLGNRLPMPFGRGMAVVLSGSMEPTLSVDDLLLVKKKADYKVGDIVVYQRGNGLVVHRIIELDGDTVTTKGDANNAADPSFDRSEIRGTVCGRIPRAGALIRMLKTPAGTIATLMAAILLMEFSFRREQAEDERSLDDIKEEIRRLKEEQKDREDGE